jgi:hypothetical protein
MSTDFTQQITMDPALGTPLVPSPSLVKTEAVRLDVSSFFYRIVD